MNESIDVLLTDSTPQSFRGSVDDVMANIPADLKQYKSWVWAEIGAVQANGKRSKKIFTCEGKSKLAKSNDPATWGTFEQACAAARRYGGLPTFALSGGDPYLCIDIDHCIDAHGVINETVQSYIDHFEAYVEVSASGNGVHLFFPGKKPSSEANYKLPPSDLTAEIYEHGRFIVVSGAVYKNDWHPKSEESKARNHAVLNVLIEQGQGDASTTGGAHSDRGGKSDYSRYTEDVVRAMLQALPEEYLDDYEQWRNVGFELQDRYQDEEALGIQLFDEFSSGRLKGVATPRKYPGTDGIQAWWEKNKKRTAGVKRTFWSLYHDARQNGWKPPKDRQDRFLLNPAEVQTPLDELNHKFFYLDQGRNHVLTQISHCKHGVAISTVSPGALEKGYYARYKVAMGSDGKIQLINLIRYWNEYHEVHGRGPKRYSRIDFDPSPEPEAGIYNLFKGFAYQPDASIDVSDFIDGLIREKICGGKPDVFNMVISFFAHLLQKPAELPLVALVFRSPRGVGKGTLLDSLSQLYAPYVFKANHWSQVIGRFNNQLSGKLLINLEDVAWGGYKEGVGYLNNLITSPRLSIEGKGQDIISVANYARVVIQGNEDWIVSKARDDRRFYVIDIPESSIVHDKSYYSNLADQYLIDRPESKIPVADRVKHVQGLMGYLLRYNIEPWKPVEAVINSTSGSDMALRELTPVQNFVFELAANGSLHYPILEPFNQSGSGHALKAEALWPALIAIRDIYQSYRRYCKDHSIVDVMDSTRFAKAFYQEINDQRDAKDRGIKLNHGMRHWNSLPLKEFRQRLINKWRLDLDHFEG